MKIKNHLTLRLSILSIYSVTFIALISIIISVSSVFFLRSIGYFSSVLLEDKSTMILQELKFKGNSPEVLGSLTKFLFANGYIDENQIINYSLHVAKNTTLFPIKYPSRIVNWSDAKGNSITTFLEPDGTFSTAVITPHTEPPIHTQFYRNHAAQIIKSKTIPLHGPDDNAQYLPAIKTKNFLWTDAFYSADKNLVTAAVTPIYNRSDQYLGVFTIYVSLEGVSHYLKDMKIGKNGVAFIINGKNELIAFPGMQKWMKDKTEQTKLLALSANDKHWIKESIKHFTKNNKSQFVYKYDNKSYIASFKYLPEEISEVAAYGWKVGIVVPESDFTGDLERRNLLMILVGISTLVFGIVLVSIFSKSITARIKLLVNETEKIKKFSFDNERVVSVIKEVDSLAGAIYSMKMNLRAFQKYMPAKLVRQLIQSGEDIQIGGEKRTLSILFSDIKNFTSITETMDPEQLMPHLCEYLDNVSTIITETQGTIDKFIGDSVMAFWGAPIPDKKHCEHACRAALLCKNKINELNHKWIKQGRPHFITRFGVHTGEVIVGNIGSSERMNYTALGDAINLSSRLEGMNKVYGTSILVSEQVIDLVSKEFVFRKIDETTIKGKMGTYSLYELLAENTKQLSFDLNAYQAFFKKGFEDWQQKNWNDAILHFKKALAVYPEDTVVPVFLQRCKKAMRKAGKSGAE